MRINSIERCEAAHPQQQKLERVYWQVDLASRYGIDRVTVYRWEREGRLPAPDIVLGRRRGRYESTLREWEASTTAAAKR